MRLSFYWDEMALKGWLGRKRSVQVLVGHGEAAGPRLLTSGAGLPCLGR